MNHLYLLTLGILIIAANPTKACVDFWPPTITVTVELDANYTEALITVSNLSLFGGPNGTFCSCAVASTTTIFSDLQYIAFVDSGTYDPVAGFAPWDASTAASSAWGSAQPGDWNGYIAEVIGPGISTGTPVELIIRAALPPGYTFNQVDSSITQASAGTDEWSASTNDLAFSHNSIASLGSAPRIYITQPLSFFAAVDSLVTSVSELYPVDENSILIWNEGGSPVMAMRFTGEKFDLTISDALGRTIITRSWDGSPFTLPDLASMVTVISVRTQRTSWTKRLVAVR